LPSTTKHGALAPKGRAPARLQAREYVERIEITDDFSKIAGGYAGYREDRGYEWYAGI
jgi:hypothetical protein